MAIPTRMLFLKNGKRETHPFPASGRVPESLRQRIAAQEEWTFYGLCETGLL